MIDASKVACVTVTRGDVDLGPVLAGLPFDEIGIWDNSTEPDGLGLYGRYAAIELVAAPVIFTQDDDCTVPRETVRALLDAYEPDTVVCNVPVAWRERYTDSGLVGFGAIFDRDLPQRAFSRFLTACRSARTRAGRDRFMRTCDLVLTMLAPMRQLDLPVVIHEAAYRPNRMSRQPGFDAERERTKRACRRILKGAPC